MDVAHPLDDASVVARLRLGAEIATVVEVGMAGAGACGLCCGRRDRRRCGSRGCDSSRGGHCGVGVELQQGQKQAQVMVIVALSPRTVCAAGWYRVLIVRRSSRRREQPILIDWQV